MQNVTRSLNKTGKQLQNVGSKFTLGLTVPLAGFGAVAIKAFADFEDGMAQVRAISGATSQEFKALEGNAKKLGETTRFTASQVAALQLNYSKLGFDPSEILKVTEATLELSLATGEDLAESASVAASTLRGFKLDASQTQRVVDVMAKSFSSSALNLTKFQTAMAVVAPVAATANQSIEKTTGLLSVLVNAGIDASSAGTGLRNIFLETAKSGTSLEAALASIKNSTNANAKAMELFGKRGATVATVLAQNYDEALKFAEAYKNAGGSAKAMAAIMDNTLKGSFFRLKSAVEGAAISVGEALAPVIRKLADFVTRAVGKFNELSPSIKKVIVVLGGIAAAIGPLLALAGTILPAIVTGFTVLSGPIGIVVAALTGIGVIIIKNWQPIKRILLDIANYFIDLYNESTVFRIAVEAVVATFRTFFEIGKFVFEALKSILKGFVDRFVNGFKTVGKIIKAVFTGNLQEIPNIIKESGDQTVKNFKGVTQNLAQDWKNLIAGIKDVTEDGLKNITERKKLKFLGDNVDASEVTEEVKKATQTGIIEGLSEGFSGLAGRAKVTGLDLGLENESVDLLTLDGAVQQAQDAATKIKGVYDGISADSIVFSEELTGAVQNGLGSIVAGFSNFIGSLFAGGASLAGLFQGLLGIVSQFLSGLGKAMIQAGLASLAFKKIFANPIAAIAAGAALIALSAVVRNFFQGGFAGSFADGGIVGGSSYFGDKLFARVNSGELILNRDQQKRMYGMINGAEAAPLFVTGHIEAPGQVLRVVLDRAEKAQNRRT